MGALFGEIIAPAPRPTNDCAAHSEGIYVNILYSAYATNMPKATADVLRATETLTGAFPAWIEFTWDLGGCTKPQRAELAVKLLARSWEKAPACLKSQLKERLEQSLSGLTTMHCYCDSKETISAQWRRVQKELGKLNDFGGASLSKNVEEGLKNAKFKDSCAGG